MKKKNNVAYSIKTVEQDGQIMSSYTTGSNGNYTINTTGSLNLIGSAGGSFATTGGDPFPFGGGGVNPYTYIPSTLAPFPPYGFDPHSSPTEEDKLSFIERTIKELKRNPIEKEILKELMNKLDKCETNADFMRVVGDIYKRYEELVEKE